MNHHKKFTLRQFKCSLAFAFVFFFFNSTATGLSSMADDYLLVVRNNTIIFDVVGAEEGADLDVSLVENPSYGKVEINGDMTLTFRPFEDICEETDQFVYQVNTNEGVEAVNVNVKVDIICEKLTFLSGFSPDGDGENDTFRIIGAESYPNNSLVIFNKWGEEVYAAAAYDNTWDGTDENGEPLVSEDNVYYYVFNDGEGEIYSGYLKIE